VCFVSVWNRQTQGSCVFHAVDLHQLQRNQLENRNPEPSDSFREQEDFTKQDCELQMPDPYQNRKEETREAFGQGIPEQDAPPGQPGESGLYYFVSYYYSLLLLLFDSLLLIETKKPEPKPRFSVLFTLLLLLFLLLLCSWRSSPRNACLPHTQERTVCSSAHRSASVCLSDT
jgi:hypothetical protein